MKAHLRPSLYILALIVIASIVSTSVFAGLTTGLLNPPQKSMCGNSLPTTSTIDAINLTNTEGSTLTNITATLNVAPNNGGVTITSVNPVSIGTLNASATYSGTTTWNISCNSNFVGNYTLYVTYTAVGGFSATSLGSAQTTINVSPNVDTAAPAITNPSPSGSFATSLINLTVTTSEAAMCRYDPSDSGAFTGNTFDSFFTSGYSTSHRAILSGLGEGSYTYYIRCADQTNNFQKTATRIIFSVDLTPPEVSDASPNVLSQSFGSFSVTTNEDSSCKYSLNASTAYENMSGIFAGLTRVHNTTLSRLTRGVNTFYIRCKDTAGNSATTDFIAQVSYEAGPTAQVTSSKQSPFKPGVIDLTITTTEDLQSAPRLTYTLDGTGETAIILSGEDSLWKGYLILPASIAGEKVGTFSYSGTDTFGNVGTTITKGSVFLVDNVAPSQVTGLGLASLNKSLRLTWTETIDNVEYYHIYRSLYSNVTEKDYLTLTPKLTYDDQQIETGRTYYYKVAAVDTAGNIGPLSDDISLLADGTQTVATTQHSTPAETTTLDRAELEAGAQTLGAELADLTSTLKTIRTELKEQHPLESDLLDVITLTRSGEQKVQEIKKGLDNTATLTDDVQYQAQINTYKTQLSKLKSEIPKNIIVLDKQTMQLTPEKDAIKNAYKLYLEVKNVNFTEKDVEDYYLRNEKQIISAKIKTTSRLITVTYLDGHENTFTSVEKSLDLAGISTQGLVVLESIPKSVIDDATKLKSTSSYDILLSDPLLRWRLGTTSRSDLTYLIPTSVSPEDLKKIVTAVLPDTASVSKNSVSGFAFINKIEFYTGMDWWVLVVFVVLIVGLAGYYRTMDSDGSSAALDKLGAVASKFKGNKLEAAHKALDEMNYAQAYDAYSALVKTPPKDQASAVQLSDLYYKLLLYNYLQSVQHDPNAVQGLHDCLSRISDHNNQLCRTAAQYLAYYQNHAQTQFKASTKSSMDKLRAMKK